VEAWATEFGFELRDARRLAAYTQRVRVETDRRPRFRDEAGRPMYRYCDREQRMVAADSAADGDAA
jgi:hypothetical protein